MEATCTRNFGSSSKVLNIPSCQIDEQIGKCLLDPIQDSAEIERYQ